MIKRKQLFMEKIRYGQWSRMHWIIYCSTRNWVQVIRYDFREECFFTKNIMLHWFFNFPYNKELHWWFLVWTIEDLCVEDDFFSVAFLHMTSQSEKLHLGCVHQIYSWVVSGSSFTSPPALLLWQSSTRHVIWYTVLLVV